MWETVYKKRTMGESSKKVLDTWNLNESPDKSSLPQRF